MAAGGSRDVYTVPTMHGDPPTVRYGVTAAAIEKLMSITCNQNSAGGETVHAVYDGGSGAAAINLADYDGFPIGSEILDVQAFKRHQKTGAATWKSSVADT